MPVLNMQPHWLFTIESDGYEDEKGNYHKGSEEWKRYVKCDVVPAGKADEIELPDGSTVRYSYTIYVYDRKCRDFEFGEIVRLTMFGKDDERDFKVLGFNRYQHQCKIFV